MSGKRILIIGAGPCGLGVGWRLTELNYNNFHIYEQEDNVGGLAFSFIDDQGFTWDIGGHVLHSHYKYFDDVFEKVMRGDYYTHQRSAWIWLYDRFVPYPFQNNIRHLPKKALAECLQGLYEIKKKKSYKPINFADWITLSFGKGIAKHFLLPYNWKIWAYPIEKMSYQWIGDRVATVDIKRIERNIRQKKDDVSWGPNSTFHFSKHGGTGEIWKRIAQGFVNKISFKKRLVEIDITKHLVTFADRTKDNYDLLLSTIPLDMLVKNIKGIKVPKHHEELHFSTVFVVGLGIEGSLPKKLQKKCWIYFPESKIPFFRATVLSNYSKYNAPKGTWSLMTEIAASRFSPLPRGSLTNAVIRSVRSMGWLSKKDNIISKWQYKAKYAYPTPTLNRDTYIQKTTPVLEKFNIFPRGRFGLWKYEIANQDHVFMQGVEWADRILLGKKEVTVNNPNKVNRRK